MSLFLIITVEDKTFLFCNFVQIRTFGWKMYYTNVLKNYQKAIIDRSSKDVLTKKECSTVVDIFANLHFMIVMRGKNV